jgi:hypothetical protein
MHAKRWIERGHHVNIVTSFPNFPDGKVFGNYRQSLYKRETLDTVDVLRVPTLIFANRAIFLRIPGFPQLYGREYCETDAIDRAPQGRELPVREGLTRIIVDWSGSWQAARPGNWLGRSPATKAALGC